jgi:hypothetical protein
MPGLGPTRQRMSEAEMRPRTARREKDSISVMMERQFTWLRGGCSATLPSF